MLHCVLDVKSGEIPNEIIGGPADVFPGTAAAHRIRRLMKVYTHFFSARSAIQSEFHS
jgi:hypothetical protein